MPNVLTDYAPPGAKPRTRAAMTAYLRGHPRYHTMNSWNQSTSYSRCIKLRHLAFPDKAAEDTAYEVIGADPEWWVDAGLSYEVEEFNRRWDWAYQLCTNGRSGGYLVVVQGGRKASEYLSYCPTCGQRNYKKVAPGADKCGVCRTGVRRDYGTPPMATFTQPGRSLDQGEDFTDWDVESLAARVKLVRDLDATAERMAVLFVGYCRTHVVETEEVLVPRTVTVVRPIA